MKHTFTNDSGWTFVEESLPEFTSRYSGFAKELFPLILESFQSVAHQIHFYRCTTNQMKDAYAICDKDPYFSVQLDPDLEKVIIHTDSSSIEIDSFSSDPLAESIYFIRNS